ncbi:MAG: DUF1963 domain-containing protein [Bacilli bacterium]|nr:DUF1963 domain-containing protein [Bacilli bacterium]
MAIKLKVHKASGDYDVGASKFLGSPVLPDKWINAFDNDTIFFLQIRLRDIKDLDEENRLPHEGYLYIFLDTAGSEYDLKPIVKYTKTEPLNVVTGFNEIVEEYEQYVDDYLIEFEKCDDYDSGNKLFGKPNDWNYEGDPKELLFQFDPLDSDMGIFSNLDGFIYFFFGKDRKTFKDVEIMEEFS